MGTNRLEAFSDGVIAVIITIMVLELKVPSDTTLTSLRSLAPQFLSYLLSFLVVAIMWVNHHHLLHSARRADAQPRVRGVGVTGRRRGGRAQRGPVDRHSCLLPSRCRAVPSGY